MKKVFFTCAWLCCFVYGQYTDTTFPGIRAQYEDVTNGVTTWYFDETSMSGLNTDHLGPNAVEEIKNEINKNPSIDHGGTICYYR